MKNTSKSKKLINNIVGSGLARILNLTISLVMMPLVVGSVVESDYALASIALSFAVFASYADLGMGLAIVESAAKERNYANDEEAKKLVNVTWSALVIVSLFVVATAITAIFLSNNRNIIIPLAAAVIVTIGIPSGIIQRILFAKQEINLVNNWMTLGKLASLAIVFFTKDNGSINIILFANICVPVIISWLMMGIYFFKDEYAYLRPKFSIHGICEYKKIIHYGAIFFTMQLLPFAEYGLDIMLIGLILGMNNIQAYDVNQKLFMYIISLISIVTFPVWPAIANSLSSGDSKWANKVKNKSYVTVMSCASLFSIIFFINNEKIIELWVNKNFNTDPTMVLLMAVSVVLSCAGMVQSTVLNGMGLIKEQGTVYWWYIFFLVILKCIFLHYFGINGAALSLCILCTLRILFLEYMYGGNIKKWN